MKKLVLFLFSSILILSCSSSETTNTSIDNSNQGNSSSGNNGGTTGTNQNGNTWSIPVEEVIDGGPGKDGIPAILDPTMITPSVAEQSNYLNDESLVILFRDADEVRAYPHSILNWHEIINDKVGDVSLAITFCPLTGTGLGWSRIINDAETSFGVSGLLYNTNLIPYDRLTDSNWSQILNECVNGELLGSMPRIYPLLETDWTSAKTMYPDLLVVSDETGFERPYNFSPYGDYNSNNELFLFPVAKDTRLPLKQRVLAIMEEDFAKVYQFSNFEETNIIRDSFRGKDYLIVGNSNFMFAHDITRNFDGVDFTFVLGDPDVGSEVVLADSQGNHWDAFGIAVKGPRTGQRMSPANVMMAMWFSVPAFYNTSIYSN